MSSWSSNEASQRVVSLLISRLGAPLIKQLVSDENTWAAVRQAYSCLTDRERELVALKLIVGANTPDILRALRLRNAMMLSRRWQTVLRIMRHLVEYFACYDYRIALREIAGRSSQCSAGVCWDLLRGYSYSKTAKHRNCTYAHVKQTLWLLRTSIRYKASEPVREFIRTLLAVRKFKRMQ